jgi:hypothetical protein
MACFERSIGTVIELVEEFFVVDPNPFKPDEVEVDFFLVDFFASRTVVGAQKDLRRISDGLNADTDAADARKMNADTDNFMFDGSTTNSLLPTVQPGNGTIPESWKLSQIEDR